MRIEELDQAVAKLREEAELLLYDDNSAHQWLEHFTQHKNIYELSRRLACSLIERIDILKGKRISIRFRYQDRLETVPPVQLL